MTFEDEFAAAKEIPDTIEDDEEVIFIDCPECEGTGIFCKATWHHPTEYCDSCNGEGGYEKVVKEGSEE